MNEKVLVTGAKGQLGIEVSKRLKNAVHADVDKLDITDFDAVDAFVKKHKIGVIVNAAAYTAVDAAEDDDVTAYKVNVLGPENLAKTGCKIVHISTDYVFDGKGYKPYMPQDVTNPLSVYGKTKLKGEEAVLKNAKEAVILRTAWLYSANGKNFVKTMLRLGSEKEQIGVVADQIGTPTYAGDLADAIVKILPQISTKTKGVYHFTNEGVCSWYDFAAAIMEMAKLKCKVEPLPSSAYPTKAVRPFYSVLDKTSVKEQFGIKIPYWRVSLKKCIKELTK